MHITYTSSIHNQYCWIFAFTSPDIQGHWHVNRDLVLGIHGPLVISVIGFFYVGSYGSDFMYPSVVPTIINFSQRLTRRHKDHFTIALHVLYPYVPE